MKSHQNIGKQQQEVKFTQLPFNQEETLKIEKTPVYTKYIKWLKENGVIIDPRLRYPSYFGKPQKGIIGISANKPIEKSRAIIAVPYNLLITVDKVKQIEQLNIIIKENLNVFRSQDDAALKVLLLFVIYQLLKGQKSFYHPYFAINTDLYLNGWQNWTTYMLESREAIKGLKGQQEEVEREFMNFLRIFRRYENIFPEKITNQEYKNLFERSYSFITTRAFGWSLPSISLIPLADSLNHGNIRYLNHFITNIEREKSIDVNEKQKFHKSVNLNILKEESFSLNNDELAKLRFQQKSKALKFVEKHKQILIQSEKLLGKDVQKSMAVKSKNDIRQQQYHILLHQYKAGIHKLRNLHFYQSSCSEDNDTDEDEIFQRQHSAQRFALEDRQRIITQKNKKKEIKKLWKLYYDNQSEEEQEEEETAEKELQKSIKNQNSKEMKQQIQEKLFKEQESSEVSSEAEEDDDQIFDWIDTTDHKKTYFIMNSRQVIRQNEQIYNFYGRRSNKFLLIGYNFVMEDNFYDSFPIRMKLDDKLSTKVNASKLVENNAKKDQAYKSRQIRLKRYRINTELINLCRSYVILWTKKQWKYCQIYTPFDKEVEQRTLQLYQQIVNYFLKQFTTTAEEDEDLLQNNALRYQQRVSIRLRREYKKILTGQLLLVSKCMAFLKKWKLKQVQEFEQSEMKWIKRVKGYLIELQRAIIL